MTLQEAMGEATVVEAPAASPRIITTSNAVSGLAMAAAAIHSTAFTAADYHPLTTNMTGEDDAELIQKYLDDSWKLLRQIEEIASASADEQFLTTYNRGRLRMISDEIKMLRRRNMNVVLVP